MCRRLLDFSYVSGHTNSTRDVVKVACFQGDLACLFSRVAYNAI